MITRHFLTIPASGARPKRVVHYRRCGSGPILLMVHQSPRSSAEYEELIRKWSRSFTCIAPDSPGFGQSDPLPGVPEVGDFADTVVAFLDQLGVKRCAAYGFHSGGIILAHLLKRHPDRLSALAIGGYAIWTAEEMRIFGEQYIPEFHPQPYGEHLAWLWNRILEQSWFFPWFDPRDETRLSVAHADPERLNAIVMEMLDAGNAYRFGYRAVLLAPGEVPPPDADTAPVLLSAYRGDPLGAHLDRIDQMPKNWRAEKVESPADHQDLSFAFLSEHAENSPQKLAEDDSAGFVAVGEGLIHWRGTRGAENMLLHAPGAELAEPSAGELAIDVPGHGLSSDFEDYGAAIEAARIALGASNLLWPAIPPGDPDRLYPDLTPDRFGSYLQRAWSVARASAIFVPWYAADESHAIAVDQSMLTPAAIALRARALLRAGKSAAKWHQEIISHRQ
ncbi:alpha/beta fold hydrolase [Parasphingorhabdus sp.]|uniref:alpha/beta hydrolase n=1 Tax=Parasphingorhabdus sp. TaxID=2709688 RepID=UPI003267C35B